LTSIDRTAYPRFERTMSAREIVDLFTPSAEEVTSLLGPPRRSH